MPTFPTARLKHFTRRVRSRMPNASVTVQWLVNHEAEIEATVQIVAGAAYTRVSGPRLSKCLDELDDGFDEWAADMEQRPVDSDEP